MLKYIYFYSKKSIIDKYRLFDVYFYFVILCLLLLDTWLMWKILGIPLIYDSILSSMSNSFIKVKESYVFTYENY